MWTWAFWGAVIERAIKTMAQAGVAALVAAGTDLINTDWVGVASIAGMATVISVLTSIGSGAATGDPSLTGAEQLARRGE